MAEVEKMLVADALDERDFLREKIEKAISNASFVTVKRVKDPRTKDGSDPEVFEQNAKSDYKSISDMISRLNKINQAITLSNANTVIELKSGIKMSRAEAISRRKEMRDGVNDIEHRFITAIARMITDYKREYNRLQNAADQATEMYKNNLTSKDRELNQKEIDAAKTLTADEYPQIIDPLDIVKKYDERNNRYNIIAKEIDTAIKVSNATTYIEI